MLNPWRRFASVLAVVLFFHATSHADDAACKWLSVSDGVIAQLQKEGKKIGWPGLTAGVAADPANGDVYMVVCDNGLWKSSDVGKTFTRVDGGAIGGRCETGFALSFDPAGGRLACFMIYGSAGSSSDGGKSFTAWKTNHLDFGAADWEQMGKHLLAIRHESGGVLTLSKDGGATWKDLGKQFDAVGMFDGVTFVALRGADLVRSTDGGETWSPVKTPPEGKLAAPVMRLYKGIGYWMTDKGLFTSKDRGETWAKSADVDAVFGPWFGKDVSHMIVVGKAGFSESLDGGKTWKVVAPLPAEFNVARVGPNYAWDPVHDVFYASSMGKPTFQFKRK
jgi:photosystem II stability/assembly factor-like uncharacterized protein